METYIRETDGWVEQLRQRLSEDYDIQTRRLEELLESSEVDTRTALVTATRQSLADTKDALTRIEENRYGICTRCQAEIPRERLEVLPRVRFCVPCLEKR